MSRYFSVPVGLCVSCYTVCLLPPTMHITVMPIGKGAISCNTCLETVLSSSTLGTCNTLPKKKKKIKNKQWTSAVMEKKRHLFYFLFSFTKEGTSSIHLTLDSLTIRASPYLYSHIPKDYKKDFSSKSHQWKRFSLHQRKKTAWHV